MKKTMDFQAFVAAKKGVLLLAKPRSVTCLNWFKFKIPESGFPFLQLQWTNTTKYVDVNSKYFS